MEYEVGYTHAQVREMRGGKGTTMMGSAQLGRIKRIGLVADAVRSGEMATA